MRDWYVEFEPTAASRQAGACCMSYQVRALTRSEAVKIATQLLKSCGQQPDQYYLPEVFERGDAACVEVRRGC